MQALNPGGDSDNSKSLRDIKNASSSLHSSAELFSNKQVAELANVVGDIAECSSDDELDLPEDLVELFAKVPSVMRSMMTDDEVGYSEAQTLTDRFNGFLQSGELPDDAGDANNNGQEQSEDDEPTYASVQEAVKQFDKQ